MRRSGTGKRTLAAKFRDGLFPVLAGTALFLAYPSLVSYQDVASVGKGATGPRWLASISEAPGISVFLSRSDAGAAVSAAKPDAGERKTGAVPKLASGLRIAPEPQRVNRAMKGARVVSAATKFPPRAFSAGSVVERHSMLTLLDAGEDIELAFVKAKPPAEALRVASIFNPPKKAHAPLAVDADLPVAVASLVKESTPNILAYAPEPKRKRSPFAALLDTGPVSIVPRLSKGDHSWADDPLPKSSFSKREQRCLTAGIYFEARGEPAEGQAAVAQVILNRVKNPHYPNSICGVVYQNKDWRNRCQFSFACDNIKDKVRDKRRWRIAGYVARETTEGRIWLKQVGSSTHYHATYVKPKWAKTMKRVGRIGLHVFYRTRNGGWS